MKTNVSNWNELISAEMVRRGDDWASVVAHTFKEGEMHVMFDCGFGGSRGIPFTLWTKTWVYFPVVYDGSEWVRSVSRNPDGIPTEHVGGE